MVGPDRRVHPVRVVSAVPVREVSAVRVPVVALVDPVVVPAVLVAVPVAPVEVLVPRVVVAPRVVAVVVGVKKNCSPVRFATPNPRLRSPKASSSSNVVSRPRSSHRV